MSGYSDIYLCKYTSTNHTNPFLRIFGGIISIFCFNIVLKDFVC